MRLNPLQRRQAEKFIKPAEQLQPGMFDMQANECAVSLREGFIW